MAMAYNAWLELITVKLGLTRFTNDARLRQICKAMDDFRRLRCRHVRRVGDLNKFLIFSHPGS